MSISLQDKLIDLSNIPRRGKLYDWKNSINCIIPFKYKDTSGDLKIVDYNKKNNVLTIEYNGVNHDIITHVLTRGGISRIVGDSSKKETIIRRGESFVNLSSIPQKMWNGKMSFDWINSIGCIIEFKYFNEAGTLKIVEYDMPKTQLLLEFKSNKYKLSISSLLKCKIGSIIADNCTNNNFIVKGDNYIDLSPLPITIANERINIDWINSKGYKINFKYAEIEGQFEILDYHRRSQTVEVLCNNSNYIIKTNSLLKCSLSKLVENSMKYDNIVYHSNGINYIDVSDVRKKAINGKLILDWVNSVGSKIRFYFSSINGEFIIKDYDSKLYLLSIVFNNKTYTISTSNLLSCKIGSILSEMIHTDTIMRNGKNYIDISEIPIKATNVGNIKVWKDSVGCSLPFFYNGVNGVLNITEYIKDEQLIVVKYGDRLHKMNTNKILKCILCDVVDIEFNKKIVFANGDYLDLSDIPSISTNTSTHFDWINSKGKTILFSYKDIQGEFIVIDYNPKNTKLKLMYGNRVIDIYTGYLLKGHLKKLVQPTSPLSITHPHLIQYAVHKEDMDKLTHGSEKQIKLKCIHCGTRKTLMAKYFARNGMACPSCSDGISYPEKFMQNVLRQLKVDFTYQITKTNFIWIENFRYDFLLNINNGIFLETHGKQHYESCGWTTVEEQRLIDNTKKELVLNNGYSYIELDFRESTLEWCKNSILSSELTNIFDFSNVDWDMAHDIAMNNLIPKACSLFNEGINIESIASSLNLSSGTIKKYLKEGKRLGLCNYINKFEQHNIDKANVCNLYNNGVTSIREIADKLSLSAQTVYRYLKKCSEDGLCNYINPKQKEKDLIISVCDLYNQGNKIKDISSKLNIGFDVVRRRLKKGNEIGLCEYATLSKKRRENIHKACKLYNEGYSFNNIKHKMNIHECTVRDYLRVGTKLGICSYT